MAKSEARARKQVAALPWRRRKGHLDVMLITSRETKRWVIPKGWPMDHLTNSNAAKREAYEEAGVTGRISRRALGVFDYVKLTEDGAFPVRATVYALEVADELATWPEKKERKRRWFSVEEAAERVDEDGLKALLSAFTGRT
jgi:8-oxo-dGTP pyrophosphatase MutT (NUDIX family)